MNMQSECFSLATIFKPVSGWPYLYADGYAEMKLVTNAGLYPDEYRLHSTMVLCMCLEPAFQISLNNNKWSTCSIFDF